VSAVPGGRGGGGESFVRVRDDSPCGSDGGGESSEPTTTWGSLFLRGTDGGALRILSVFRMNSLSISVCRLTIKRIMSSSSMISLTSF